MQSGPESEAFLRVDRTAIDGETSCEGSDAVACEEPLEIQLEAESLAVVMRTPGHDLELALGFLVTERVIERADQVVSLHACTRTRKNRRSDDHGDGDGDDNVVRAVLAADVVLDADALRRNLFASSSCGVKPARVIEARLAFAQGVRQAGEEGAFEARGIVEGRGAA